ncbi:MAG TPA: PLP-dependent aminotransferase family protein, partial [Candidatus Binatia bacterium]|nr:PLP-dependent aminotransferase family protein [Candidatus Binatia bacterium]
TMPSFQNPTGISTSLEHRRRLLAIAARHGVPILEDEFQKDLRVHGRPVPPLRALDGTGRVIYVGTFSKALFPGSRVGWIVAPPSVAPAMVGLKRASDLASSSAVQAALANFCRTGEYDRHVRRASAELGIRLDRAIAALEQHLPRGSTFTRPEGGFALWVTLPDAIDTMALLPAAKQAGVVYSPGALFFTDGRRSSALRLSVALAGADDIERGIHALGDVARATLTRGRGRALPVHSPTVHV